MTEVVEYRDDAFVWPKGAKYWGELLPYLRTDGGKRFVVYSGWWTEARLQQLQLWTAEVANPLRILLGPDHHQRIRAMGKEAIAHFAERGEQPQVNTMMAWSPDPVQRLRIEEHATEYIRTREWVRSSLREARSRLPGMVEDLPGDDDLEWTPEQMTAAALRLPQLLMTLARLGEIPDPGLIVPERALVQS